jgi:photosystem II stability/assembly factor-like uncharacterized protein
MTHTFRIPRAGATTLAALALAGAFAFAQAQDPAAEAEAAAAEPAATENAPADDASTLPPDDPAIATAEPMPLASKSLILDITNAANRAVAVGERGHILVSPSRRDNDWTQVTNVPTRATLTAVTAVGDKVWAVGHDGVILHSPDGGLAWTRQRVAPYDPDSTDPLNGAPLLDVIFFDEHNGLAIGAYSMMLRTGDGGATWTLVPLGAAPAESAAAAPDAAAPADATGADAAGAADDSWTFDESELELEEETDPHLNAIARTGDGSLFIVAERGAAFRSSDGGATWQRIQLPYEGSMFGVLGYEGRHVLAFGLRGNVFESTDLGDTWRKIDTGVDLSIMGGVGWGDGGAALVGANGVVLTRSQRGQGLLKHVHPDGAVLSSAISLADGGELVVAGENGVGTYTPN